MKNLKDKLPKIIFCLSFSPLIVYIVASICVLINGIPFTYSKVTGWSALILLTLQFLKYGGLFAACFIYQMLYYAIEIDNFVTPIDMVRKVKRTLLFSVLLTGIVIYVTFAVDDAYDSYTKKVYQVKPYADPCIFVLEYDDAYKDTVDTVVRVSYEDMFAYVYTTYGDEGLDKIWKYKGDYTSYAIATSPIIEGEPEINDDSVKINVCEGKKDLRISVDYKVRESDKQYIIICMTDSALNDTYTLSSEWSLAKTMPRNMMEAYEFYIKNSYASCITIFYVKSKEREICLK